MNNPNNIEELAKRKESESAEHEIRLGKVKKTRRTGH